MKIKPDKNDAKHTAVIVGGIGQQLGEITFDTEQERDAFIVKYNTEDARQNNWYREAIKGFQTRKKENTNAT